MSSRHIYFAALAAGLMIAACPGACAQPTPGQAVSASIAKPLPFVSPIFGDNMVLQRGKPDTIWGWSDPGDIVRVQIGENTATGNSRRRPPLASQYPAASAGRPLHRKITGHQTVEMHNVLVGDVWLCGGQSNMGLPLQFTKNADDEIKAANYPEIRFFTVQGNPAYHHVNVIEGNWSVLSPETAKSISAVGYYFARKVQQEIHVPIGLVVDAMGGTPAEAWASEASLRPIHDFDVPLALLDQPKAKTPPNTAITSCTGTTITTLVRRPTGPLPASMTRLGSRSQSPADLPNSACPIHRPWSGSAGRSLCPIRCLPGSAMLHLGEIERMDTVYINGQSVGGSAWVENPRVYPAGGL